MYLVDTDELAKLQVAALPRDAQVSYLELRTVLEVSPWSGEPVNCANPEGPVRTLTFGRHHEGMVAYLILEDAG